MAADRIPNPGVRFPPPLLFVAGFVAGWGLHRALPLVIPGGRTPITSGIGWLLIVAGSALAATGLLTFFRHRTGILPHHPASRLVTGGPYRYTRNPMYVGLTTTYIGLSLLTGMIWPLLTLPIALVALRALVIRREERYLESEFGEEYERYRKKVRRWI